MVAAGIFATSISGCLVRLEALGTLTRIVAATSIVSSTPSSDTVAPTSLLVIHVATAATELAEAARGRTRTLSLRV